MDDEIIQVEGEVITPQDRIKQLQEEVNFLRGGSSEDLSKSLSTILSNPGALKQMFGLSDAQSENIASLMTGGAAGLSRKYLTQMLGPEIAGAVGGFLGGYLSKKMMGR